MALANTSSATLVQQVLPRRGILENKLAADALLVVGGSLFVALCAQIRVPLPFSPVPITAQTMAVLLVGSLIGSRLGLLAMLLYLVEGMIGLPFFTGGKAGIQVLQGATAGYLVAFPIAAALTGWLAEKGWDRTFGKMSLSMILGNLVIYALGVGWLTTRVGLETAFVTGMLPFVLGDLVKIALASAALPGGWELLRKKG